MANLNPAAADAPNRPANDQGAASEPGVLFDRKP